VNLLSAQAHPGGLDMEPAGRSISRYLDVRLGFGCVDGLVCQVACDDEAWSRCDACGEQDFELGLLVDPGWRDAFRNEH
jgi:hypothetical protein